jgi:hypothetical protein
MRRLLIQPFGLIMLGISLILGTTGYAQDVATVWPAADNATPFPEFEPILPTVTEVIVEDRFPGYLPPHRPPNSRLQLFPQGVLYRAYLAGVKESRLRSVWNHDKSDGWFWDITLGGRVPLLRYGTEAGQRPEGFQVDMEGAGIPRLSMSEDAELESADFRFGIPVTWGTARHQVKLAFYHLSSHLGDEFMLKNPTVERLNYSRDALVYGHSFYPTPWTRLYAEVGYAFGADEGRPLEAQFGWEYSPPGDTGCRGAPFAAAAAHLREEAHFGGNVVGQIGWAWRSRADSGLFRIGMQYYNGKSDQYAFYYTSENKLGLGLWYDY